jgi:hypothetical protein
MYLDIIYIWCILKLCIWKKKQNEWKLGWKENKTKCVIKLWHSLSHTQMQKCTRIPRNISFLKKDHMQNSQSGSKIRQVHPTYKSTRLSCTCLCCWWPAARDPVLRGAKLSVTHLCAESVRQRSIDHFWDLCLRLGTETFASQITKSTTGRLWMRLWRDSAASSRTRSDETQAGSIKRQIQAPSDAATTSHNDTIYIILSLQGRIN